MATTPNLNKSVRADEADPFAAYELWGSVLCENAELGSIVYYAMALKFNAEGDDAVSGPQLFYAFKHPEGPWDVRLLAPDLRYAWISDIEKEDVCLERTLPSEVVRQTKAWLL